MNKGVKYGLIAVGIGLAAYYIYRFSTRSREERNVATLKAMSDKEKEELKKSLTLLTRTPLGT